MKKRLTAWLLTLSMLLTVLSPLSALAASHSEIRAKIINILYGGAGGRMSCDFDGYVNTSGRHEGIDFTLSRGAAIYSISSGTVTRVTNSSSLSTLAIYDSARNKTVVYLHGNYSVSVGDTISQGQYIGTEASNGASAAHTHVEVRNGRKTAAAVSVGDPTLDNDNPYPYWEDVMFGTSNRLPEGSLDNCEGGAGYIHVRGWSFDWDSWGAYIAIHVYIDGAGTEIIANTSRPDVENVYPGVGPNHGFDANIPASAGTHTVTVYAIDNEDSSQHSVLGEQTVTVSTAPSDTTGPDFSSCSVTQTDSNGYTLSCTVSDPSGVDRVEFMTWTTAEGKANALTEKGTRNGNTFTYRVKKSDHGNATSGYMTYIIAYDKLGNWSGRKLNKEWSLPIDVTGISLNKSSLTFNGTGSTQSLTATVSPSNASDKTVTWSSSNTSVATVSGGTVKAVGYGTATITAKTNNGKTATCTVTVKDTTAPTFSSAEVVDKDSFGYTVRCKITDNHAMGDVKFYTWTTAEGESKAKVVTVTPSNGYYSYRVLRTDHNRATSGYTTRVDAYDKAGNKTSKTFSNISIPIGVDKVTLSTTNMTLAVGGKQTITATITPSNAVNHTIKWTSGNTSVATVSDQGVVTATGNGTTIITATASNGVTATCTVNVVPESLTGISVASKPNKTSYYVGDTLDTTGLKLQATYNNGKTEDITGGFTYTPTQLNTAGTQTIKVSYCGKSTTFTVTVEKAAQEAPYGLLGVAPTSATAADGKITGTTEAMEWAVKGSSSYTPCTEDAVTGLASGTYLVRYAQTATHYASATVEVTVPAYAADFQAVTLTFDPTDGVLDTEYASTKTVYTGELYGRLPEPTATGYVFTGWYTDSGKRITAQTTCELTQDTTVRARWEPASAPGYDFDSNTGTLTIDCTGAMEDYLSAADTPWYSYRASIRSVVVKSGVTALSSYAFAGCENLTSVSLPDTLRSIGTMAFYDCDQLTSIVIPASVRTVGSYAFADDGSLSTVTFRGDAPAFGTGVFTVGTLEVRYPVYASGWETVIAQHYGFGGSIQWTRSSDTADYSAFMDDILPEEPELYEDASLALDWTL